jgi:hypothetical protein
MMKKQAILLAALLGALLIGNAQGDTFLQGLGGSNGLQHEGSQGSSLRNDRFLNDPSFIGQPYDWSGVGLSSNGAWATMISPTFFVSANHDHPGIGNTITFHTDNNPSGTSYTYTVDSTYYQTTYNGYGSDLYLGKLTTPVAANIAKYPVLALANDSAYSNLMMWTYGYPNRVGKNNIDSIEELNMVPSYGDTRVMYYDYNATGGQGADEAYLEPGDSGGPDFVVENGALALVGIHFVNSGAVFNGASSGSSFVPYYVSQLDAHMTGGEQVTIVPEPASLLLLLAGTFSFAFYGWRRRRETA